MKINESVLMEDSKNRGIGSTLPSLQNYEKDDEISCLQDLMDGRGKAQWQTYNHGTGEQQKEPGDSGNCSMENTLLDNYTDDESYPMTLSDVKTTDSSTEEEEDELGKASSIDAELENSKSLVDDLKIGIENLDRQSKDVENTTDEENSVNNSEDDVGVTQRQFEMSDDDLKQGNDIFLKNPQMTETQHDSLNLSNRRVNELVRFHQLTKPDAGPVVSEQNDRKEITIQERSGLLRSINKKSKLMPKPITRATLRKSASETKLVSC